MSVAELRAAAKCLPDNKQCRRVLAIAMVLDGFSRQEAAQACGMDRQSLRDWVHRYNAHGLEGLADRPRCGRPTRLTKAQQAEVASWVKLPRVRGVLRGLVYVGFAVAASLAAS
jgi:transposase